MVPCKASRHSTRLQMAIFQIGRTSRFGKTFPIPQTRRARTVGVASSWNTMLQAHTFGEVCSLDSGDEASEDCLNLNIWSLASSSTTKRPVVSWSFLAGGSAAQPLFDGAGMADQGLLFKECGYLGSCNNCRRSDLSRW